jgi:hypothetical protein
MNIFQSLSKNSFSKVLFTFSLVAIFFVCSSFLYIPGEKNYIFPQPEPCYSVNNTFQHGEELTYKLYYNVNFVWVAAGEVTFSTEDLGNQWHLKAVGKTYNSYDWFFKVRDYYDTYLDKNSMLPIVSVRDVAEGKYKLYDKVVFDQTNHKAVSYRGDYATDAKKRDLETSTCMHDLVSLIYYCRNVDYSNLQVGAALPLRFFLDREEFPISVKYKGKVANVALRDMGKYNTIKFSPQVVNGRVFKDGSQVNIWASDDANKIPLMIESPLSVGSVKVVLKSYKGLRYPFQAKVG